MGDPTDPPRPTFPPMSTIETALTIAATAHAGQADRNGLPYILHPLRVMERVETIPEKVVAILHDVVEDTAVTLADLRQAGFEEGVLAAVERLTHAHDQPYHEYVIGCAGNQLARAVKLADLFDNSRLPRMLLRADREASDLNRVRRYVLAYQFLTDRLDEAEYRRRSTGGTDPRGRGLVPAAVDGPTPDPHRSSEPEFPLERPMNIDIRADWAACRPTVSA